MPACPLVLHTNYTQIKSMCNVPVQDLIEFPSEGRQQLAQYMELWISLLQLVGTMKIELA